MEQKYVFEQEEKLNLKNLKLLPINPRFTYFGNEKENFSIENIYNETFKKENEIEVLMKIFSSEENLEDSYELFESLIDNGYDKYIDRIWAIKTKYNNYYVLEGNRRTLFLKIILNINNLRKIFFNQKEKISENICKNIANLEEKNKCINKNKKFIKKINEKINENDLKNNDLSIYTFFNKCKETDLKNDCFNFEKTKDKILKRLRNKHMIPNIKGKKDWNRLLVLKSYLDIFKNYENKYNNTENIIRKISKDYQISLKKIDRDLRSANWINKLLNSLNKEKRNQIIENKNYKISAIEISPSTLKILGKNGNKKTLQKQIKLEYIKYNPIIKNGKWEEVANFLFENFENGNFTTRGWKNEKEHYKLSNFFGEEEYNLKFSHLKWKEKNRKNEYIDEILEAENSIYKIKKENEKKIIPEKNKYIYKFKKINGLDRYNNELKNIYCALQNFKKIINWVTKYELKWLIIPDSNIIFSNNKNEKILKHIIGVFGGLRIIFDYLNTFLTKISGLKNKNIEEDLLKKFNFKNSKINFLKNIKNSEDNFEKWLDNILNDIDNYDKNQKINYLNKKEFHNEILSWLVEEEKIKSKNKLNIKKDLLIEDKELKNYYNELEKIWIDINKINYEDNEMEDNDWNKKPLRNYVLHNFLPILKRIENIDNRKYFEKIINLVSKFLDKLRIIIDFIEENIEKEMVNKKEYISKINQESLIL
ncbi:hypothetical protein X271_00546 [Candidatus Hepatoplasma crinochetorum Av]|uniref:ParB/Sulfiredoxin domain-containing protein n=1 Tax=Candidatus Hepatoplasma crinochetorum Av TaxID=1427984 RepID=W8GNN8_9MOLU|nr:hypothetical protein [Candidatus Hepatoplasma crinochetorum]AHK22646.1 hypothetical protein X271_00546 [Candidatus Hepatoplasma crinochetorum Av]